MCGAVGRTSVGLSQTQHIVTSRVVGKATYIPGMQDLIKSGIRWIVA
jgi:hypothetical protein